MFDAIDDGDDHRIDFGEFNSAVPSLSDWGIQIDDSRRTFAIIDANGGGHILFEEFCEWALKQPRTQSTPVKVAAMKAKTDRKPKKVNVEPKAPPLSMPMFDKNPSFIGPRSKSLLLTQAESRSQAELPFVGST